MIQDEKHECQIRATYFFFLDVRPDDVEMKSIKVNSPTFVDRKPVIGQYLVESFVLAPNPP